MITKERKAGMFRIGDFSKLAQISVRMLRHYDKLALIKPVKIDATTGYRYYEARQLEDVERIRELQSMGFSLKEIKWIFEQSDEKQALFLLYENRYQALKKEAEKLKEQMKRLKEAKPYFKHNQHYLVKVKTLPERRVLSLREKIPNYNDEGVLWKKLYQKAAREKISFSKERLDCAIFHDASYLENWPDVEVQSVILDAEENFNFKKVPEQLVASITFSGSYEKMAVVTETFAKWIESNPYEIAGPMLNIYHVSKATVEDPEKWLIEACFQVKRRDG